MASAASRRSDHLVWKRTTVDGRGALYGVAGQGLPVVFLHGWGLGQHAYKRALKRLVRLGCQVFAPAPPRFGGTADLPGDQFSMDGYARWVGVDVQGQHRALHGPAPAVGLGDPLPERPAARASGDAGAPRGARGRA